MKCKAFKGCEWNLRSSLRSESWQSKRNLLDLVNKEVFQKTLGLGDGKLLTEG